MAEKLHITWAQYHALIEQLALKVHESGWFFDQIVCIARGGLRIGDVLSRIYEMPLAILSAHSYNAGDGTVRGELIIAEHITMISPKIGERILLVDDMADSGITLKKIVEALPQRYPDIKEIKTAVLWWKACSIFKPDYWIDYLPDSPWICQPFEIYDQMQVNDISNRQQEK
ncbi:MAG: phosphoribosyltransferase [Burkholderiales bacterium]|nr:phosphoribosyltransferase [Burkholderiales bacterium]